jgi:TPR repeat protein
MQKKLGVLVFIVMLLAGFSSGCWADTRADAEKGDASAQFNLGFKYDNGLGVTQDYVLAHKWWNLSGANGYESAIKNRGVTLAA